jgi:hypothetical protein
MPAFAQYVGIDYSGAQSPTASLKGLRIYAADRASPPVEVIPPPSARKYWTRRGIAEWLVERPVATTASLFRFDISRRTACKLDWPNFLDDFQRHWPTDRDIYVDFVRDGLVGQGAERMAAFESPR